MVVTLTIALGVVRRPQFSASWTPFSCDFGIGLAYAIGKVARTMLVGTIPATAAIDGRARRRVWTVSRLGLLFRRDAGAAGSGVTLSPA
jgi:hypothetical protein